jgi:hypothetical protein
MTAKGYTLPWPLNAVALNHFKSTSHAPPATASVNQGVSISAIAIYRVSGGESPVMHTPDSRGCGSRGANGGTKASTTSAGSSLVTRQPLLTHPTGGVSSSGCQIGEVVCCLRNVFNICMLAKTS